jgi:hypothetical protein
MLPSDRDWLKEEWLRRCLAENKPKTSKQAQEALKTGLREARETVVKPQFTGHGKRKSKFGDKNSGAKEHRDESNDKWNPFHAALLKEERE